MPTLLNVYAKSFIAMTRLDIKVTAELQGRSLEDSGNNEQKRHIPDKKNILKPLLKSNPRTAKLNKMFRPKWGKLGQIILFFATFLNRALLYPSPDDVAMISPNSHAEP